LHYFTASKNAWVHGGSSTKGFLRHVAVGPVRSTDPRHAPIASTAPAAATPAPLHQTTASLAEAWISNAANRSTGVH
jgi:hypothetical protein